jgi:hypothetical protein
MIKGKGKIRLVGGVLQKSELDAAIEKLKDGDYDFLITDHQNNKMLPHLTYLFSVVLKGISDQLPDHPSTKALYRYFEVMFAPRHTEMVNGKQFEYCDLKSEKTVDVSDFIERVIEYAQKSWNITVATNESLRNADNREFYSLAYQNQEVNWNKFISSKK